MKFWPNCLVADCPNKVCIGLSEALCFPHVAGLPLDWFRNLSERQIEERVKDVENKLGKKIKPLEQ